MINVSARDDLGVDPLEEAYWEKVDAAFDIYHDDPEYGRHLARVLRNDPPRQNPSTELQKDTTMGMMKNYFLNLLQQCSEEQFGQEVVEWAIVSGVVKLSYNLDQDVQTVMGQYDALIDAYRKWKSEENASRWERDKPVLEEMLRNDVAQKRRAHVEDDGPEIAIEEQEQEPAEAESIRKAA